jgi:peroxiredoxin family protein
LSEALAIAVHAGAFDRVHYALVMASAAAASDRRAVLFFTGAAVAALTRRPDGQPGWHGLEAAPEGAAARDAAWRAKRVAGFEELLAACRELRVRLIACEMALRVADLAPAALRDDLKPEVAGVVTFLHAAAGGATVFV